MSRIILYSFLGLFALPVAAQEDDRAEGQSGPVDERDTAYLQSVENMAVQNTEGEQIGEIAEILVDENGEPAGFLLEIGGFVGLMEKDVQVPLEALQWDGSAYVSRMTEEQLEDLAPWDG
ncbi:MAG: PRC-barrel domain-containing protein [Paracoccaceae bacterium]